MTLQIYKNIKTKAMYCCLFPPHSPAILPDIDPKVGIDLNVAAVGGQEEVEDVVAVELGDATPRVATHRSSLQLPVIGRINAVDETAYFYCLRHGSILWDKNRNFFGKTQKRSDGNSIFIFLLLCDLAAASRASWEVYCS